MPKRKRGPGAGRPLIGEARKSAVLTARLDPQTRRALDEAAAKAGLSVSRMAERVLSDGLRKPSGEPRNLALGCAVTLIAEKIERDAGCSWRDDPFTRKAVCSGVIFLLGHFLHSTEAKPAVPPAVEEMAAKRPPETAGWYRAPDSFGYVLAGHLTAEIQQAATKPAPNEWTLPIFFSEKPEQLAIIGRELITRTKAKGRKP